MGIEKSGMAEVSSSIKKLTGYAKNKNKYLEAVKTADRKAKRAQKSAKEVARQGTSLWNVDTTLKGLQQSNLDLAEALIEQVEAQKRAFVNQRKITEVVNYLFEISITNMATYRKVVSDLTTQLKNLSDTPEDKLIKEELTRVINQFKRQESILQRLDNQAQRISKLEEQIKVLLTNK